MRNSVWMSLIALAGVAALGSVVPAQQPADPGVYTAAQAATGKTTFEQTCVACHGQDLRGTGHGPALRGPDFLSAWGAKTTKDLFEYAKNGMPPGGAGTLSDQAYLEVVAYILQTNGLPAGPQALRAITTAAIRAPAAGAAQAGGSPAPAPGQTTPAPGRGQGAAAGGGTGAGRGGFANKEVEHFAPVTEEMLQKPPAGDWLSWRRTLDSQAYSPLDQITRDTVQNLQLAWVWAMRDGSNEATPLVHDGVMYLVNPTNVVQALDAKTGSLIWEYRYPYPPQSMTLSGPTRNIAIYKDKLFLATYDAALVAIDARTGKEVWKTVKADYKKGYTHTSGPIVAGGVVVSGINGCEKFKEEGCFVTGHDPDTGKEIWRTSTIARPGEANGDTWGSAPANFRAGGDTWIPGSYDPQLKLFYIGTAQAKPWVAASRGMSPRDAALYTNSTLALDPQTGKMSWYFQHVPGESLDMDVVFERVLIDVGNDKVLFTVGKDGILWKLDRRSGKFVDYKETVFQNVFDSIDRKTGRVTYRADILEAKVGQPVDACPGNFGGHDWQASAYSPEAGALIVPLLQACMTMVGGRVEMIDGGGGYGGGRGGGPARPMPGVDGNVGKLAAFDVKTMKELWSYQQHAMFMTGAVTTAGGLVFVGDVDRYLKAFDVKTGKLIWQTRLGAPLHGFPISYSAGGKQYIAVPTGLGVFRGITGTLNSDIYQASNGNALYVFELPDRR